MSLTSYWYIISYQITEHTVYKHKAMMTGFCVSIFIFGAKITLNVSMVPGRRENRCVFSARMKAFCDSSGARSAVEMGRMSDYNIRPKPKVWAGSPNECRTFGRTSAECCMLQ